MNPMTSLSALSANMGAFGIIATILAIIATVAAFILVVPESKREKLGRFGKFLHDAVNFKFLIVEKILQALYIFVTAYLILCGFFMLFMAPETWTGRHWLGGYGILLMVLGPIAVRLCYELLMMAVLLLKNVIPKHMDCISAKLMEMGVTVEEQDDTMLIRRSGPLQRANVKTLPYPGFPTDMQPQITTLLTLAEGTSIITEGVWEQRFRYVDELRRMGADISVDGKVAVVEGTGKLTGAPVKACDLRAGAALIIAGLAAHGVTEIEDIYHIERGYANLDAKLRQIGADIQKVSEPTEAAASPELKEAL